MIKKSKMYRRVTSMDGVACMLNLSTFAAEPVVVNVDNFVRAETAVNFDKTLALLKGEVNTLFHFRKPMPLDGQSVNYLHSIEG